MFRVMGQYLDILKNAKIKIISKTQFASAEKATDLVKAMSNHASFTPEDAELQRVYSFTGEPVKVDGYWNFPMFSITEGYPVDVSQFKLANTELKGKPKLNWFNACRGKDIISIIKFIEFKPTKVGENFVLPKYVYDVDKVGKAFGLTGLEVDELWSEVWDDQEAADKTRRRRTLKFARKTKYADVLLDDYLTDDGQPNEEALKYRAGVLVFEDATKL